MDSKPAGKASASASGSEFANPAVPVDPEAALRLKHARNKANTVRNAAKVESYLMDVERAQGYAKSWALRERLEKGLVSLDELTRR